MYYPEDRVPFDEPEDKASDNNADSLKQDQQQ